MNVIWYPDPQEISYKLDKTDLKYPRNVKYINAGYKNTPVIPSLYNVVCQMEEVPVPDILMRYLWDNHRDKDLQESQRKEVIDRTIKLVFDFYREIHLFGLLAKNGSFGLVKYSKATDISLAIDYLVSLASHISVFVPYSQIGVQAAIGAKRSYKQNGYFQRIKQERRKRRGDKKWSGEVKWVTNEKTPAVRTKSNVLLFTGKHVKELVCDITGTSKKIGIQQEMNYD